MYFHKTVPSQSLRIKPSSCSLLLCASLAYICTAILSWRFFLLKLPLGSIPLSTPSSFQACSLSLSCFKKCVTVYISWSSYSKKNCYTGTYGFAFFKINYFCRAGFGKLCKEPVSEYFRLMGHIVSVITIQLYNCNTKAAIDNIWRRRCDCVPIIFFKNK